MKIKKERAAVPYSCLIDNIKVLLIFLVVFNHIIAFNLVKVDTVVRYVWYAITISHMPAFVFISGYLSKKPQNVLKNFKNLLIPYVLGYTLTWYSQIWLGRSVDYEILRPTGSVMWYILALFIYRLTICIVHSHIQGLCINSTYLCSVRNRNCSSLYRRSSKYGSLDFVPIQRRSVIYGNSIHLDFGSVCI